MILLIDNYDSFVHNLARYVRQLGRDVQVVRNDALDAEGVMALEPEAIILSPGPCTPDEAGNSLAIVRACAGKVPTLGVCLGHQTIGQVFGGKVSRAVRPMHGKTSLITHNGECIFKDIPNPMKVTRYHSLIVQLDEGGESPLVVDAVSEDGEIMAFHHRNLPVFGVQFHPEAILTEHGYDLLRNFLTLTDAGRT